VEDTIKTYLGLYSEPGLLYSPSLPFFIAYLLDHMVQHNMTAMVVERGGVILSYTLVSNPTLPLPVREKGFKLLLLLAEDFFSLDEFLTCGVHEMVCYYMSPAADSSPLVKRICHALLQAMNTFDVDYGKLAIVPPPLFPPPFAHMETMER